MTLKEKHLADRNKIATLVSLALQGAMLLISLLALILSVDMKVIARIVIVAVLVVVNIVGSKKYRTSVIYSHFACMTSFFAYIAMIATFKELYVYAFIFPISVLVMIFQDASLIKRSAAIALVTDLIYFIVYAVTHPGTDVSILVIQMILIITAAITAVLIIITQQKHMEETSEEIEERAAQQAMVAREVVKHAQELADKFIDAMEVSDTLNECMDSSHSSVSEIAESTKLTAEAIEQQTAQTYEIQVSIQKVEEEAKEMASISEATKSTVEEGVELIEELKKQALEVAKISHETEQTTKNLNASIKEVEAITETILGISSQTNLLALNASIEAARAGEAGKGFAVVADEIRNLSEGTKEATEQISAIINKLTVDAENASESMSRSAHYAEKQNEMIDVTGDKLHEIQKHSDALYGNVQSVNQSVDEVVVANTAISDSISNLSATSEQVAASTESSLTLSDSSMAALEDMNRLLKEIHEVSEAMRVLSSK
ncbi:MAG: methyl-accepting chemotaxis protein [bacterium]|nr:methyl-accepting chemotaxis protein [bacterium]